jgi:predicted nucleic acid-binding protein
MKTILIDSCFWIALYDTKNDPKQTLEAEAIEELIQDHNLIIPFPTLYEFVSSRLSRRETVLEFEKLLYRHNIKRLKDTKYRDKALENFFIKTKWKYNDISLVDEIIKLIMLDKDNKIDMVISFDKAVLNEAQANNIEII